MVYSISGASLAQFSQRLELRLQGFFNQIMQSTCFFGGPIADSRDPSGS